MSCFCLFFIGISTPSVPISRRIVVRTAAFFVATTILSVAIGSNIVKFLKKTSQILKKKRVLEGFFCRFNIGPGDEAWSWSCC